MQKRNNKISILLGWHVFVFLFMYVWFVEIHPLVIYDADDWQFVAHVRRAFPMWGDWNPARVLPEFFMPIVSTAAVHLLYPLTGDYIGAITVGAAFTVSLFIVAYMICFAQLVKRMFHLTDGTTVVISSVFFVFHFLVFRAGETNNEYMFYCWDVTCYFFYLIPSLLNASLVMIMIKNDRFEEFWSNGNMVLKGLFVFALYMAIFSNLPASGILAAFSGCRILLSGINAIKQKNGLWKALQNNGLHFGILLMWFVSAIFELSGGRATFADESESLWTSVTYTLQCLLNVTGYCGKMFLLVSFVILAVGLGTGFFERKTAEAKTLWGLVLEISICGAALFLYIAVLVVKVGWSFANRTEYRFGLYFYLFLLVMMALCFLVRRMPKILTVLPVLICILVSSANTPGQTFKEGNMGNIDTRICKQVCNDVIGQILQADREGKKETILYVPVSEKEGNWPFPEGNGIAHSLHEHGLTSVMIETTVVPTMEMNEKYHLGLSH